MAALGLSQEEAQITRLIERNVDGIVLLSSQLSGQKLLNLVMSRPLSQQVGLSRQPGQ